MTALPRLTADAMRRPNKGHYISGAGHLTLIGWVLLGGVFSSEPPEFELTEVSVISSSEFDALIAGTQPPANVTEVAQPEAPEVTPEELAVAPTPDPPVEQPVPEVAEAPAEETPPEVVETPPPPTEVADVPPELDQPLGDVAVLVPSLAPKAVPRPVARVAPTPVAQPDPDVRVDDTTQEAVAPDETGETPEEPQEATAQEEATSEIVTEATAAPKASQRPPGSRPAAPERVAEVSRETQETGTQVSTDDVNGALEEALAANPGPPLTLGEKERMLVAVSNCWNVDVGGRSADTIVTVGISLDRAGKVVGDVVLLGSEGGDDATVRTAFGAARRAVLRCQKGGYPLPAEKFEQWKSIEITFNPSKMRVK